MAQQIYDSRHQSVNGRIYRPKNESLQTARPHVYESCHLICKGSVKYFPMKVNGFWRHYIICLRQCIRIKPPLHATYVSL